MSSQPVRYHLGKFPPKEIDWPRLIPLIGPASAGLARYFAFFFFFVAFFFTRSPPSGQFSRRASACMLVRDPEHCQAENAGYGGRQRCLGPRYGIGALSAYN